MPAVSLHVDATPERAWEVLSQPRRYAFWVAGAHGVHEHDGHWPQVGATFRHTQGRPPLVLSDTTSVLSSEPPRRLELEARVRPLLVARVTFTVEPEAGGCRLHMDELPVGGVLRLLLGLPPAALLIRARNTASLRRLKALAESGGAGQEQRTAA